MRALELRSLDGPSGLVVTEREEPAANGGSLVDVKAAGVCFPDLLITRGSYQVKPELPAVLGLEISGTVREPAPGSGLSVGDRVWGSVDAGGHAEVVAVPPGRLYPLPDSLSFEEGAALPVNFMTAVFALKRRGGLAAGETVLVLGAAGGLGSALVSVAERLGARVIAVVSTPDKEATARAAGAHEVIVGADWRDEAMALTEGRGADLVADVVGGDETVQAVRATAPEGRVLVLGFASGGIPAVPANRLLLKNVSLVGVGLGALVPYVPNLLAETADELIELIGQGLKPIVSETFPLEEGAEALRRLEDRSAKGKLVLTLG